jgi:hypothetical protein
MNHVLRQTTMYLVGFTVPLEDRLAAPQNEYKAVPCAPVGTKLVGNEMRVSES